MKAILCSLSYYLPHISGISIYAAKLARFCQRHYPTTILTAQLERHQPRQENTGQLTIQRVPVDYRLNKGLIMWRYPWYAWQAVRRHQLVIVHAPQLEAFFLALAAKIQGRPLIVIHHCDFAFPEKSWNRTLGKLIFLFHLFTYQLADQIVTHSYDYAQHSPLLRRYEKKITFILPPISYFHPQRQTPKQITIGFVGRLGWEKGLDVLFKALPLLRQRLPSFRLVLIGPQHPPGNPKRQHFANLTKKWSSFVQIVGPVSRRRLSHFYRQFSCLVLPSTNSLESFGLVQAEAMVSGCPVVATNLPGVRVPVQMTGMGEIAKVNDPQDLAEKIITVIKHRPRYQRQLKLARQIFAPGNFCQAWQRLITSYLDGKK